MLSTKLNNLYSNMLAFPNYFAMLSITLSAILLATFLAPIISMLFALAAFIENKNLVLRLLGLAIGSYVITDSVFNI